MQRFIFSTLILFISSWALANSDEIKVDTKITEVTVYQQNALIHREAEVQVPAGNSAIILHNLNSNIRPQDVRINAKGDFTILSITYRYQTDTLSGRGGQKKRDDIALQIQKLQAQIQRENGFLDIYAKEEKMLLANQNFTHKEEGVDIDRLVKASDFIRTRFMDIKKKRLEIQDSVAALQREINELSTTQSEVKGLETKTTLEMVVRVNSKKSLKGVFIMDYRVYSAGWIPSYDATVDKVTDPFMLEYNAKVYQSTGEDWSNVNLTIATGNPNLNKKKPSLLPWYISGMAPKRTSNNNQTDYNAFLRSQPYNADVKTVKGQVLDASSGEPLPFVNVYVSGTSIGTTTDLDGSYSLETPNDGRQLQYSFVGYTTEVLSLSSSVMNVVLNSAQVELQEAVVIQSDRSMLKSLSRIDADSGTRKGKMRKDKNDQFFEDEATDFASVNVSYSMTNTKFKIDAKYSIPSDGKEYAVQIQEYEMNASYIYKCSPKLDPTAYLTAEITDWEDYNLLNGPMNIYFEEAFIGQSQLDLTNAKDTLSLSLGEDKGISVVRNRVKAENKKQVLGSNKVVVREWEFTVRNNKREPITLIIDDQLPITTTEEIEIKAEAISGAQLDELTGKVKWELDLNSGKEKKFNFKYTVKYPKAMYLKL